jgi:hypothetical protein
MAAAWPSAAPAQYTYGEAIRSCVKRVADAGGKEITTIEGLSADLSHPLQRAWIEIDVPQCGYCQSGQIVSQSKLSLMSWPKPGERIHTNCAGLCLLSSRACARFSISPRRKPVGANHWRAVALVSPAKRATRN